ncbi:FadR/GntR family transcriptional regulator [Sphingobium sp. B12D2B]|uniref:FadR/GntR family transcriptional regulator n=1 Tax=Sphingobium sp. B12D2B TaxID=2940577 RepID=UPI00222462C5|nr:FadR/GntR family transcriptional regulator [Sphingobium sp. B12D2B]MCW2351559.1 DNA-binding FadR family transcriptional regulator [Sphingobium sp. B12D2B]
MTKSATNKASRRPVQLKRQKTSLHRRIAHDLGVAIVTGKHHPGDILATELNASDELSVSRSAYREAIRVLAAKGLVESRQRTGTVVMPITRWALLDPDVMEWMFEGGASTSVLEGLVEMRLIIEPAIASLAAQRRTLQQIARMREALQDMERFGLTSEKGQAANRQFYEVLLQATANPPLVNLGNSLGTFVLWYTEFQGGSSTPRETVREHWALFDAVAAGAAEVASAAMEGLIRST